jgi:FMN-dependent NADH-azoreductase
MNLLHIDSSILGSNSVSRQISAAIVQRMRQTTPQLIVHYRDLAEEPVLHLAGSTLAGMPGTEEDVALGGKLLQEFLDADIVVIGVPMYNFTIPTQLKAWIDRIVIVNRTFRYTETGPVGLAGGKRVIIALSRGGISATGSPAAALDHQEPYLRAIFGFMGIRSIDFVRAEGCAISPAQRDASLKAALGVAAQYPLTDVT